MQDVRIDGEQSAWPVPATFLLLIMVEWAGLVDIVCIMSVVVCVVAIAVVCIKRYEPSS